MAQRRTLVTGLTAPDPQAEKEFVYGGAKAPAVQPNPTPAATAKEPREGKGQPSVGRVPFTTRVRGDLGQALKRASLERQLQGVEPSAVQDIFDDALEPWLRAHGYLK
jgi:hypothetical protein